MKPYYQDEWVTIYHGDCREILPSLPKVDLVLTDPPYGLGFEYESYDDTRDNWVDLMDFIIPMGREMSTMMILPCCRIKELGHFYRNYPPDWLICWYKGATSHNAFIGFNNWEPLLVYGRPKKICMQDYFYATPSVNNKYTKQHPCPKPENWANHLISKASLIDNVVLDPFLGSGTTAYCAKKLNRHCIGIEIEEKYCEIAAKRCSQSVMNFGAMK